MKPTIDNNCKVSAEQRFWQSIEQGTLLLSRCVDTGKSFFYPRDHSPFTGGSVDWVESNGRGVVYSYCVSGRSEEMYCLAYIQLDDGPIIMSNVLSDDLDSIKIGCPVKVVFQSDENGRMAHFFKLA